jgi:hypothetical protein
LAVVDARRSPRAARTRNDLIFSDKADTVPAYSLPRNCYLEAL